MFGIVGSLGGIYTNVTFEISKDLVRIHSYTYLVDPTQLNFRSSVKIGIGLDNNSLLE
jgi:hypothetical protein